MFNNLNVRIVFLATRISGNDGVSLEAVRWSEILARMGHKVTFVAGELDRGGFLLPELHFQNPQVVELHEKVVYSRGKYKDVEAKIFALAGFIEGKLREVFNRNGKIDLLIVPNVFSLPMHLSLSVALARVIDELGIPTIARHHDFWWERQRYLNSSMFPFFYRWFPPISKNIFHIVINTLAKAELKKRAGIDAQVIWDCFDFKSNLAKIDSYSSHFREDFVIDSKDIVFLQPTRIVPRKRIEISIRLVQKLDNPNIILIVAGKAGDEGYEYEKKIRNLAKNAKIRCKFIGRWVNSKRRVVEIRENGVILKRRIYTLWDAFTNADFVVYPTKIEGFGNQFVESVYFKKPIILTPYPVYKTDISPLGFEAIEMPGRVTKKAVSEVTRLLENRERLQKMVEKNFLLGKKYFSYQFVEAKLVKIFRKMGLE